MTTLNETLIPYRPDRNPDTTPVEEVFENPEEGTNCELLVHAIVSARGFVLPLGIRSSEIYFDREFTREISDLSQAQTGDIIGLSSQKKAGFKGIHIGIVWKDNEGNFYVVHNARHAGFAKTQTIDETMEYSEHEKIAWIKRPDKENPALLQSRKLSELGFGYLARNENFS